MPLKVPSSAYLVYYIGPGRQHLVLPACWSGDFVRVCSIGNLQVGLETLNAQNPEMSAYAWRLGVCPPPKPVISRPDLIATKGRMEGEP